MYSGYYIGLHPMRLMPGMAADYGPASFSPEGGFTVGYWCKCSSQNSNYTFSPFQRIAANG